MRSNAYRTTWWPLSWQQHLKTACFIEKKKKDEAAKFIKGDKGNKGVHPLWEEKRLYLKRKPPNELEKKNARLAASAHCPLVKDLIYLWVKIRKKIRVKKEWLRIVQKKETLSFLVQHTLRKEEVLQRMATQHVAPQNSCSAHSLTWLDKDLGSRGTEEHGLTFSRHLQCCSLIPMNNTCSVLQKMGFILTLRSLLPRVATTLNQEII